MVKKYRISFRETTPPILQLVTKFGGQPVWLSGPEWPVSRKTGNPMCFICQIALAPELFGEIPGRMAYLFMTDEAEVVDGTWEPDGGENAVIVQPGHFEGTETLPLATGPSLCKWIKRAGQDLLSPVPCEFGVELAAGVDPALEDLPWTDDDRYFDLMKENKVGGTPVFLQNPEFPEGRGWRLLLQLNSMPAPFEVNFGDAGVGYAFLSEDGTTGKFLWQCS